MKPVWMFVLGAVVASGLVFYLTRPAPPPPAPAVQSSVTAEPVEPAPAAVEPAPAPEPAPVAAEPPRSLRPSAVPYPELSERASRRPSAVPKREAARQPAAQPQQTARVNEPTQPASSQPAASQQSSTPPPFTNMPPPPPETRNVTPDPPKPEPRQPKTVTVPAGTLLTVRIDERLSTETNHSGDSFRATLDQPLVVDGFVIAERGSRVEGRIVEADAGGRVRGLSRMSLELVRLNTADGQRVRLQTESFARQAERTRSKDAAKVGAAAGIGAAIGAIAGGGKGAAIGAAVGGATGAGGVMATRGEAAEVAPETRLSFRLREAVTLTEKLD